MEQARTNNGSSESEKAFAERKEREAQREEARQVLAAERDARQAREADREEKRAENREAREAEEHAARMEKMQQEEKRAENREARGPGEAEQRFAELLGVGVQVAGIYKPVAEAHAGRAIAGFKTDTCFEEVKQELLSRILKAQTPEELVFIQKQLAASHEVATVK